MCGRYTFTKESYESGYDFSPSYNIAPSQTAPTLIKEGNQLVRQNMQWGYPIGNRNKLVNARCENLYKLPSYKNAKRCAVPFSGWYEWFQFEDKSKHPFYFFVRNIDLHFAGIYVDGGYCILTRPASTPVKRYHHRMPVLLKKFEVDTYINGNDPFRSGVHNRVECHAVSKEVNNPRNNHEELIRPILSFG